MTSQNFDPFYEVEQAEQDAMLRMGSEYENSNLPREELEDFLKLDGPSDLSKWQEPKSKEIFLSFGKTVKNHWSAAKDEINSIIDQVLVLLKKKDKTKVNKEDLINLFYGPKSRLYSVFLQSLDWSHCKFMR